MKKIAAVLASMMLATSMNALATDAAAASSSDLSKQALSKVAPFPQAKQGMTRQVIYLPAMPNEDNMIVELMIGKNLMVDCNQHALGGKVEVKTLEGFGYHYLEVVDIANTPMSTMRACPNGSKQNKFVLLNLGEHKLQHYNSRLPIVIYAPKGVNVKYRVWQADNEVLSAKVK